MSVAMKITLTNMSIYCIASKRALLQWRITSADPPGIMFAEFLRNIRWLWIIHNGNTRLPALCAGKVPNEKLKINELGPYTASNYENGCNTGQNVVYLIVQQIDNTDYRHCSIFKA